MSPRHPASTTRSRALVAAALVAAGALGACSGSPATPHAVGRPGAGGAGDPYFPRQGNGGYDVDHYALTIAYTPSASQLSGQARIRAQATQALSRFDLDLRRNMHVSSVRVNGARAKAAQPVAAEQELVITPVSPIADGADFTVDVAYTGVPEPVRGDGLATGWIRTDDGAFVAGEPQGAPTWFPVNDTPVDKASYDVTITVPKELAAISNGALLGRTTVGGRTTWRWHLARRVPSYLVTATIGTFDVTTGTTDSGLPYLVAVDPSEARAATPVLAKLPAIIAYFTAKFGSYPFGTTGAIVDDALVGYALETATRPLFDRAPDEFTLAHELAHQWYGDDVTSRRWRDIWLSEGFAQFASWLWLEHQGQKSAASFLDDLLSQAADDPVWNPPPANPGRAQDVFARSVYDRGAGALQALREKLGERMFFSIMRGWVAAHAYGNATVEQFTAYAEKMSGSELNHFFDVWLYRPGKPGRRVP